jgi:hypothetical protein
MTREQLFATADHEAAEDARAAGPEAILAGAVDAAAGADVLADLLAHELAAAHRLMLRIAAAAHAVLDWSAAAGGDTQEAELAAGRLAATASRLMEQLRQGLAALRRLRPQTDLGVAWRAVEPVDPPAGAAAPQARSDSGAPQLSARALAAEEAAELAADARAGALAAAAADAQAGLGFLARLLAHELGTVHALAMRLAGGAHDALDRAAAAAAEPTAALRLAGIVARLGLRFRRGLLALVGPGSDARRARAWGLANPQPTAGHGVHPSDFAIVPAGA